RVSYRETIKKEARCDGSFDRPIASTPVRAKVGLVLKPNPGKGIELAYAISKDDIAPTTVAALEQSIRNGLQSGWLGYPVIDLKVTVRDLIDSKDVPPALNETAVQA